jgi:hypothetical protein
MPAPSAHLRYSLSRAQRLVPLLRIWGTPLTLFIVVVFAFFSGMVMANALTLTGAGVAVFGGLAFFTFLLYRGMLVGLLDVLVVPVRHMDVTLELVPDAEALGIQMGGERWYLFLDGITDLRKFRDDTWTIQHWNGRVLHVAASALDDDQLAHIQAAMARGQTPEGVRIVIARGQRIDAIQKSDRDR